MDRTQQLIIDLGDVRRSKAELDRQEKAVLSEMKPLVDPAFDSAAKDRPGVRFALRAGDLELTRVAGISRSVSSDKLLERGVSPEIVAYATRTTSYFQYRVGKDSNGDRNRDL